MKQWMIYGANGFTGKHIARRAKELGMSPILAGRSASVAQLAKELGFECRLFDLDDPKAVADNLKGIFLCAHCAGPFSKTSRPMVDACLAGGVNYFDITGEIEVFEAIFQRDEQAKKVGIALIPGMGFDVVPTDCLAKSLSEALPAAVRLELAFGGEFQVSPGTSKTMLERAGNVGMIRKDGKLTAAGNLSRKIPFPRGEKIAFSLPWGDVSTAYRTTGIPNIVVYAATGRVQNLLLRSAVMLSGLIAAPQTRKLLHKAIDRFVPGPSDEAMKKNKVTVWGRVEDSAGKSEEKVVELCDSYLFTREAVILGVKKALEENLPPGASTPSLVFGKDFVNEVNRCAIG